MINPINNSIYNNSGLSFVGKKEKERVKIMPLLGSFAGTGIATAMVVKNATKTQKGFNSFKKVLTTDFADTKNIFTIAMGSILGGLTGGIIQDKGKKTKKKVKEGIFQLLSNVIAPLCFLSVFKDAIKKLTKNSPKYVKNIGNFVSVFSGVVAGAFVGANIANTVNNLVFPGDKYKRKLGIKDFLIHVDDLPTALAFAGIPYIDKLIPVILVSRGYDVGEK